MKIAFVTYAVSAPSIDRDADVCEQRVQVQKRRNFDWMFQGAVRKHNCPGDFYISFNAFPVCEAAHAVGSDSREYVFKNNYVSIGHLETSNVC